MPFEVTYMTILNRSSIVSLFILSVLPLGGQHAMASENLALCENRGGYPWGWNPVTLTSCRLDEVAGDCIDTDGDGWGWNGHESCLVSNEDESTVVDVTYEGVLCVDNDGDGWGWQKPTNAPGRSCFISDDDTESNESNESSENIWPNIPDVSGKDISCYRYQQVEPGVWAIAANGFGNWSWTFREDGTGFFNGFGYNGDRLFTWIQSPEGVVSFTSGSVGGLFRSRVNETTWRSSNTTDRCFLTTRIYLE